MPHFRRMVGEKCYLSPREDADTRRIEAWDNDLDVLLHASMNGTHSAASSLYLNPGQPSRMLDHLMMIIDLETDRPMGWGVLVVRDQTNRRASLGIIIGEKAYWGKGYGTDATRLLLDYGFNVLNLHSVELSVYSFNERAIRCYEKVGFTQTGRHREARILRGKTHDIITMDILASEFGESSVAPSITM